MISAASVCAWDRWINVTRSQCHLHFELEGGSLETQIAAGWNAGRQTSARVVADLPCPPRAVLEVGSSVGFNCLAMAERFPEARVVGVEPADEACAVAQAMAVDCGRDNMQVLRATGERLPFADAAFDSIICHTVIEHVSDVDACIAEMARVLRPGGVLHLDAPNYLWPWEPHLRIVVPPLCPKPLMRLLARAQGAGAHVAYLDHLKLVHPAWIERRFRQHGLTWVNRSEAKLRQAAAGDFGGIVSYGRMAKVLAILRKLGLADLALSIALRARLYPSILYTARKSLGRGR